MKNVFNFEISESLKKENAERLNSQKLFMNPRTGTVQDFDLWQSKKDEDFDENELVEVKLVAEKWVRVN